MFWVVVQNRQVENEGEKVGCWDDTATFPPLLPPSCDAATQKVLPPISSSPFLFSIVTILAPSAYLFRAKEIEFSNLFRYFSAVE